MHMHIQSKQNKSWLDGNAFKCQSSLNQTIEILSKRYRARSACSAGGLNAMALAWTARDAGSSPAQH